MQLCSLLVAKAFCLQYPCSFLARFFFVLCGAFVGNGFVSSEANKISDAFCVDLSYHQQESIS